MRAIGKGFVGRLLTQGEIRDLLGPGLGPIDLTDKRVPIIIPDGTLACSSACSTHCCGAGIPLLLCAWIAKRISPNHRMKVLFEFSDLRRSTL